ncbi:MAG TPA: DUF4255 domain-containing protein [Micromonosporaceae bacterium]|nr:DUF4255 domain-containing protein [Micromonosporaceae bacterium]
MIHDVDACLGALIKAEALAEPGTEVVFDAPTTSWAARRSGPAIDVFLYDIREDVSRRDAETRPERDPTGRVTGRRRGARFFKLSYLLTAWTNRPQDEHRLLGQLLETLLRYDRVPAAYLSGRLQDRTVLLSLALPAAPDRSLSDLWSALGGEMKPSLDLVVGVAIEPAQIYPAGPPVLEPAVVTVLDRESSR